MERYKVGKVLPWALLLGLPLLAGSVYAANPIDLSKQNASFLGEFVFSKTAAAPVRLQEIKRVTGADQAVHVRVQQTYLGYTVWGADAVVHLPKGSNAKSLTDVVMSAKNEKDALDGTLYTGLQNDLADTSPLVFNADQAKKAEQQAIASYQHKVGLNAAVSNVSTQLIVFVDSANKAHWAYLVKFSAEPAQANAIPAKPAFIMDATSFQVYQQWDEIKTLENAKLDADGGGFGGNIKMGKLVYDGLEGNLAKLSVQRDDSSKTCFLQNDDVTVRNYKNRGVISFACNVADADHNNVYWDGDLDKVNDGYSPGNDALFGGAVIKNMYKNWYGLEVLTENGKPMMLTMVVHDPIDNAYWDGRQMTFGDGVSMFYPLTSLGVAAHEISHGFTEQHSNLSYYGQSGGMNEAFSDMAAQAAEVFAYGKNSWQIGPEIFKEKDKALRYMDKPSKDCGTKKPGSWCSIDDASQYYNGLDVHFSSGVYNRFFYTLGTTEGWDAKKAFGLMVEAQNYWTSSTNFAKGACGVMKAATKKGYDTEAVKAAFKVVGVNSSC